MHQITPPDMPTRWVDSPPRKYPPGLMGGPLTGRRIAMVLNIKLLANTPAAKITTAVYGVILPAAGAAKLSRSVDAATKR